MRRLLGRGGMGVVYLAVDDTNGARVAVKIVSDPTPTLEVQRRFAREIEAAATMLHPNIVRLRRSGAIADRPFAVFDYVPGISLDQLAPLSAPVAAHVALQLANAVDSVHAHGYLHRDLKPSNVLVGRHARATLIDLGLAKPIAGPVHARRDDRPAIDLTHAGTCVGTPHYLAPEIRQGRPATTATDVYGFGVILHRLFSAELRRPTTPSAIASLVERCTADRPGSRPAVRDIIEVLASCERRPGRIRTVSGAAVAIDTSASTLSERPVHRAA